MTAAPERKTSVWLYAVLAFVCLAPYLKEPSRAQMLVSPLNWNLVGQHEETRQNTAADGTLTWTYTTAFTATPTCVATAAAGAGSTDIVNVQFDGAPTTTQAKVRVNRTMSTNIALLSLNLIAPATAGVTPVHIECKLP